MSSLRVEELAKELDHAIKNHKNDQIFQILEALSSETMTVGLLQKTQLGKTVNNLKKLKKDKTDIFNKATQLVEQWKAQASKHISSNGNSNKTKAVHNDSASISALSITGASTVTATAISTPTPTPTPTSTSTSVTSIATAATIAATSAGTATPATTTAIVTSATSNAKSKEMTKQMLPDIGKR
ncbi:hypothetical protein RFI_14305, partial [Reticulomyxa filosa]